MTSNARILYNNIPLPNNEDNIYVFYLFIYFFWGSLFHKERWTLDWHLYRCGKARSRAVIKALTLGKKVRSSVIFWQGSEHRAKQYSYMLGSSWKEEWLCVWLPDRDCISELLFLVIAIKVVCVCVCVCAHASRLCEHLSVASFKIYCLVCVCEVPIKNGTAWWDALQMWHDHILIWYCNQIRFLSRWAFL